jgi:hypothetical protein
MGCFRNELLPRRVQKQTLSSEGLLQAAFQKPAADTSLLGLDDPIVVFRTNPARVAKTGRLFLSVGAIAGCPVF